MCGRYLFWDSENQDIEQLVSYAEEKLSPEVFRKIALQEVTPGSYCFACVSNASSIHTGIMKWGFSRRGKTVINARSETCFSSLFFNDTRSCVLPCSGYYEWGSSRNKHLITGKKGIQYLGGLYHMEKGEPVFVIVTQPADSSIASIHDRQPLLFDQYSAKLWCNSPSLDVIRNSIRTRTALPIEKDSQ